METRGWDLPTFPLRWDAIFIQSLAPLLRRLVAVHFSSESAYPRFECYLAPRLRHVTLRDRFMPAEDNWGFHILDTATYSAATFSAPACVAAAVAAGPRKKTNTKKTKGKRKDPAKKAPAGVTKKSSLRSTSRKADSPVSTDPVSSLLALGRHRRRCSVVPPVRLGRTTMTMKKTTIPTTTT
jgi:hypothetical protein